MIREESPGWIGLGIFYEDKEALPESLEKVAAHEPPRTVYLSHRTYIDNGTPREGIEAKK